MKWQTLAPELIYEVISQCRANLTLSVTALHLFPWYLGHICSAWREVFVSSPQFWNTLDIKLDFIKVSGLKRKRSLEQVLEVARISMVRSKNSPISFKLSIVGDSCAPPAMSHICRQMIEILVANSARWRDAYMYVPANEMITIYAAKSRMPLLRSIQLVLHAHCVVDNQTFFRAKDAAEIYGDFLLDATQLTRISFAHNSPFWKINWSSITVVYFNTTPPLSQLLAYLSQMSCLTELALFNKCEGDKTLNNGIVLPHLKALYSPVAALFPIVKTPALHELRIWTDLFTPLIKNEALKAIIPRYFQSIRHLSKLQIFTYTWQDAALIIEHMPRVDHLILYLGTPTDLLKILKDYPQMAFLKTVRFIMRSPNETAIDSVLEIMTSWKRKTGGHRGIGPFHNLTEMSFEFMNGYYQRFVDRLELHLEEQGMHHSISEHRGHMVPQFEVL